MIMPFIAAGETSLMPEFLSTTKVIAEAWYGALKETCE